MTSPYNTPQYGGFPQAEHPQATTVLILGVLGIGFCPPLGIAAWIMGNTAIKEIDAKPGFYSNRGTVNAGRICGIVGTVITALIALFFVVALVAGLATSSA